MAEEDYEVIRIRKDCIPSGGRLVEAYETNTEIIVCGDPPSEYPEGTPEDDWHDCDAMGCGTLSHVIYRLRKPLKEAARDCPMCGASKAFTIDPHNESRGYCSAENKTWTIHSANSVK
jgi:hypothetical protein